MRIGIALRAGRSAGFADESGFAAAERDDIRTHGEGRCEVLGKRSRVGLHRPDDLGV